MDKTTEKLKDAMDTQPVVVDWLPEMDTATIADGIYKGMSDEDYNKVEAVRATQMKSFVDHAGKTNPGKYAAMYLNDAFKALLEAAKDQAALVIGNKVHERTLFGTADYSTHPDIFKTTTITGRKNIDIVECCAASLLARPTFQALLNNSYRELVAVATCPVTGLRLKAKMDIVDKDLQTITDIKTAKDLSEILTGAEWKSAFLKYGYPIQEQHYLYVADLVFGESLFGAERKMMFAAVEKGKDYDVAFVQTDAEKREGYKAIYHSALKELSERIKQDNWFDAINII